MHFSVLNSFYSSWTIALSTLKVSSLHSFQIVSPYSGSLNAYLLKNYWMMFLEAFNSIFRIIEIFNTHLQKVICLGLISNGQVTGILRFLWWVNNFSNTSYRSLRNGFLIFFICLLFTLSVAALILLLHYKEFMGEQIILLHQTSSAHSLMIWEHLISC